MIVKAGGNVSKIEDIVFDGESIVIEYFSQDGKKHKATFLCWGKE